VLPGAPPPSVPLPSVPPPGVAPPNGPPVTLGPVDGVPPAGPTPLPGGAPQPTQGTPRTLTIRPRSSVKNELASYPLPNDETAYVYTGGIILTVTNAGNKQGLLDIEGDRLVVWSKGNPEGTAQRLRSPQGETSGAMEFYIAGRVEMRYQSKKGETETLRADEVYYDVGRNVAIALQGDLEIRDPKLPYPLHFKGPELHQLNSKTFETSASETYSTALPSDPGLKIELRKTRIQERQRVKYNIFGFPHIDPKTGEPLVETERYFTGWDMVVELEGIPIFYWPYYTATVEEPLGPLKAISANYNRIFGFQLMTTWDMFSLLGIRRPEGSNWRLYVDYLTARGPALGSQYDFNSSNLFGLTGKFENLTKVYGILDSGQDIVGSGGTEVPYTVGTTVPITHPNARGRFLERFNAQEMPDGFSFQGQVSLLSDRNFLEQYYQWEFLNDLNQSTFAYLKQQQDIWAWSVLAEPHYLPWYTQTAWLPKAEGWLLGVNLLDRVVSNTKLSAGYALLRPTDQPPFAFEPTDVKVDTARLDLWQELSLPFALGPFKVVPYVVGDVAYYSEDVNGDQVGRLYGGAGVRASVPFSKLYPDVCSELFNVDGIFHKIVLSGNYYNAYSTIPFKQLPQLDRLNDDVTDFTLRNMHVLSPTTIPLPNGLLLAYSPLYNPQDYAVRRLLDTRTDTLDTVEAVQFDLRQRWQTKRGFPGSEHIVDWMTLDVSASIFPDSHRDDFGHYLGFVDYDWLWNIGDRTALFSSGWFEPFTNGARVYGFGASFNRPDTTNFTIAYRQIDPVDSRAVIGQITLPFSAKYAMTASTTWDFGAHNQTYTLLLTRKGTDVLLGLGVSYSSILRTFSFTFEVVPNLLLSSMRPGISPLFGGAGGAGAPGAPGAMSSSR
jgi:hypothetical protein